jgi:hypothetical protein
MQARASFKTEQEESASRGEKNSESFGSYLMRYHKASLQKRASVRLRQ